MYGRRHSLIQNSHWRNFSYADGQRELNSYYNRRRYFERCGNYRERQGYERKERKYLEGDNRCGRRSGELGAYNKVRGNTDSQKGYPFARKDDTSMIRNAYSGACRPTWRTAPEQSCPEEVISRDPRHRHPSVKPVLESPTSPGMTPPTSPLCSPSSPPSPSTSTTDPSSSSMSKNSISAASRNWTASCDLGLGAYIDGLIEGFRREIRTLSKISQLFKDKIVDIYFNVNHEKRGRYGLWWTYFIGITSVAQVFLGVLGW